MIFYKYLQLIVQIRMCETMKYSAGMVSTLFWWRETQLVAQMYKKGISEKEIIRQAVEENIFVVKAIDRRKRIGYLAYKRVTALPEKMRDMLAEADFREAKLLVLFSIMLTERLFFEYCHEVYYNALVMGTLEITDSATNKFFSDKINESEKVAKFSVTAIYKLKQTFTKMLFEAGVISSATKERKIIVPIIGSELKSVCEKNGMIDYIKILTGSAA